MDPLALSSLPSELKLPAEVIYDSTLPLQGWGLSQTCVIWDWVVSLSNFKFHYLKGILPRDISYVL